MGVDQDRPVPVSVIGMDPRSRAALEMIFEGPARGAYVLAEEDAAAVTLVDHDGAGAPAQWSVHRERFPTRPAIVLSVGEQAIEGALCLRKPVKIAHLLQALQRAAEGTSLQAGQTRTAIAHPDTTDAHPEQAGAAPVPDAVRMAGVRPALSTRAATRALERKTVAAYEAAIDGGGPVDFSDPEQLQKLSYTAEDYVGGQILKVLHASLNDGITREIRCWHGRIVILPGAERVFTDLPDVRLKQISIVGFKAEEVQAGIAPFEFRAAPLAEKGDAWVLERELSAAMQSDSVESFTWKVSAWVSRGRMPAGTDLTRPVILVHWPNLTRLLMIPNAMRIAALWAGQPRSLVNTARALKIPLAQVLTFYSAAKAIGLITPPKRQVDFLFQPDPVVEHGSHGVLRRILDKLLGHRAAAMEV